MRVNNHETRPNNAVAQSASPNKFNKKEVSFCKETSRKNVNLAKNIKSEPIEKQLKAKRVFLMQIPRQIKNILGINDSKLPRVVAVPIQKSGPRPLASYQNRL